ncbi:MAG: uroporphyrinogen-III C-methyltransferase [Leptospira sp.]|nr:uroporphyrinogen-III C-methyltransferase [Leptospira sp.]
MKPFVSIVGAGPGDPELLTRKGYDRLTKAEVILYDALLDPGFLELFPANALIFYVGKRSGEHSATQEEINDLLVKYALEGKTVVRLKGGDPFVFGRAGEEIQALVAANIPFEVVPGVSSIQAGGADGLIPLTHRKVSRQLLVLDGHTAIRDGVDWKWLSSFQGTMAILMGTKTIQLLCQKLIENGMKESMPIGIVVDASLATSFTHTSSIGSIAEQGWTKEPKGPGIIYIGESVRVLEEARNASLEINVWKKDFARQS